MAGKWGSNPGERIGFRVAHPHGTSVLSDNAVFLPLSETLAAFEYTGERR
jgi:hypothetical protein